jgi:hypothetical protein
MFLLKFAVSRKPAVLVKFACIFETSVYYVMREIFAYYFWWNFTYLLTNSMEQSPSLKANRSQLVKKFPAVYGTRKFITAFTSARQLSLSWASSIQSVPPHPTSWRLILIVSSHICHGIPSGLFLSRFPHQNPVYAIHSTFYMPRPSNSFRFDHPKNNIGWGVHITKLLIM